MPSVCGFRRLHQSILPRRAVTSHAENSVATRLLHCARNDIQRLLHHGKETPSLCHCEQRSDEAILHSMAVRWITVLLSLLMGSAEGWARGPADDFRDPPASARPWVYWFFMDGNLSREGITADLEAMKAAGIGGVILMEVDVGVPRGSVRFIAASAQRPTQLALDRRLGSRVSWWQKSATTGKMNLPAVIRRASCE